MIGKLFALVAVLGTGVVYGTDVFCAMVQRPALARIDDRALLAVMGNIHRYGDRRMPVPGVLGLVAAAISAVFAATAGRWTQAVAAGKANMVDVVTAVAETETAVQTMVSVRDKVIAAYEDILKMPI